MDKTILKDKIKRLRGDYTKAELIEMIGSVLVMALIGLFMVLYFTLLN